MKRRDVRAYLYDVEQAAGEIFSFIGDRPLDDYLNDSMLRSAVERQFEIIGEALRRLADTEPELVARISDHRRIIGFRDRLIHGYAVIDHEVVWGTIEKNLPTLRDEVHALLAELDPPDTTSAPRRS